MQEQMHAEHADRTGATASARLAGFGWAMSAVKPRAGSRPIRVFSVYLLLHPRENLLASPGAALSPPRRGVAWHRGMAMGLTVQGLLPSRPRRARPAASAGDLPQHGVGQRPRAAPSWPNMARSRAWSEAQASVTVPAATMPAALAVATRLRWARVLGTTPSDAAWRTGSRRSGCRRLAAAGGWHRSLVRGSCESGGVSGWR
jgi:hypothetical protein